MPIFEYRCSACAWQFEMLLSQRGDAPPCCPKCGSPQVAKLPSAFAVTRPEEPALPSGCRRAGCERCRQ